MMNKKIKLSVLSKVRSMIKSEHEMFICCALMTIKNCKEAEYLKDKIQTAICLGDEDAGGHGVKASSPSTRLSETDMSIPVMPNGFNNQLSLFGGSMQGISTQGNGHKEKMRKNIEKLPYAVISAMRGTGSKKSFKRHDKRFNAFEGN